MKEIQTIIADKTRIVNQTQINKQKSHLGTMLLKKGCKLYQMSIDTGKIELAPLEESKIHFNGKKQHKVKYSERHLYLQAINLKNAKRKFTQRAKALINGAK